MGDSKALAIGPRPVVSAGAGACMVLALGEFSCVGICIYGLHEAHPNHHLNEVLLADVLHFASELRYPVVIGGDLNDTSSSLSCLAMCEQWKFFRATSDESTTRGRKSHMSSREALDHLLVNAAFRDHGFRASVSYSLWVSDHYPLEATFEASAGARLIYPWPSSCALPKSPNMVLPWNSTPLTYSEWSEAARSWIANSYDVEVPSKTAMHVGAHRPKQSHLGGKFAAIHKAQRGLKTFTLSRNPSLSLLRSLLRKLAALGVEYGPPELLRSKLDDMSLAEQRAEQKNAISAWKKRTMAWNCSSSEAFRFLRNSPPRKSACLDINGTITASPTMMWSCLNQEWQGVDRELE